MDDFKLVKQASYEVIEDTLRDQVLLFLAGLIEENSEIIIAANKKDLAAMAKDDPKYDRLQLNKQRIFAIAADVATVARMPFTLHSILEEKTLPNGLQLKKQRVPLGVVAAIYESRPNVSIDIFSLCFKSGNACILKGGKEAHYSNIAFYGLIHNALKNYAINPNWVYLMSSGRDAVYDLLNAVNFVDVCIPRGSQQLIDFIRHNAKIPIIETGAGVVHTYFDSSGDLIKGRQIILNAKTRRVSVCNALDTLIIQHNRLNDLSALVEELSKYRVKIFADQPAYNILRDNYPTDLLFLATAADFGQEFLSYKLSIKTVDSVDAALVHIRQYSSRHSEAIIAEDRAVIDIFLQQVDAAVVYVNASTAFTDGGEFGMGAEVGISTQKLHVRGPMGLDALTSYKWLVYGNGQIRS